MKVIYHNLLIVVLLALMLAGCGKKASKNQAFDPTIPVKVQVVGDSNELNYRNYVGTVHSERQVSLSFPLGGTLTEVHVRNGQSVRKGELIAKVDETAAKSLHDAAMATLRQAEDGYRRLKQLHEGEGISDVRWVQMETDLEKARQSEISARKHLKDCTLYASQNGVISMKDHVIGEQLNPLDVVCQIVDMNSLIVEFSVPENEVGLVGIGATAYATIPALDNAERSLTVYDKSFLSNPLGHSYNIKARISSDTKGILPGMVVKIRLALQKPAETGIIVPSSCVQTMSDGMTVWVIRNGKSYRQKIEVSEFVKNGVQVSSGLRPGDTIVTEGYQKLYNGAPVSYGERQ
jgi:RND family efflux transporter MFP subunit